MVIRESMLVFTLYSWTSPIINYFRPSLSKVVIPLCLVDTLSRRDRLAVVLIQGCFDDISVIQLHWRAELSLI